MIDESYNANPASMRATLVQLGATPAGRRIAVLGSMKELGDLAPSFHAQLAEPLAEAHVDYVVLVGEEMLALARELGKARKKALGNRIAYAHCGDPGDAIRALEEFGLAGGDAVLVKGSNSVGLGRVVAHFAAREG
jgi:UDP-N-acetylmuramoyl-tripeptide--D-alanyl-D-alanine ligase